MQNAIFSSNYKLCKFCLGSQLRSADVTLATKHLFSTTTRAWTPSRPTVLSSQISKSWISTNFKQTDSLSIASSQSTSWTSTYASSPGSRDTSVVFGIHVRSFSTTHRLSEKDKESKVEQTKDYLKEKGKELAENVTTSSSSLETLETSGRLQQVKQKLINEMKHYYNGFKLFFIEVRISGRYLKKVLNGDSLSRRERKQFLRTVADIFRLVPFTIFIIVPFMEFLLPVAIKIFPGMLPSTFKQNTGEEDSVTKTRLKLKLELAKFLQDTVEAMGFKKGSSAGKTARKFSQFVSSVQQGDVALTNEEILKFSKAFEDTLMLDNLERKQLSAICKIINITPIGPTNVLLFQIKLRLRAIHADDVLIRQEGLNTLELSELQTIVRDRGMRAYGVSKERLELQLREWLELHLDHKVPLSLLLLSRSLYLPTSASPADMIKATIIALPEKTSQSVQYRIAELEGEADNTARLDKIRREEEAIAAEAAEKTREAELQVKAAEKSAEKVEKLSEVATESSVDRTLADRGIALSESKAVPVKEDEAKDKEPVDRDILKVIGDALVDVAEEKSKVSEERDDLQDLKDEIIGYNEALKEAVETGKYLNTKLSVSRGSKLLSRYLQYSIRTLEPSIGKIESEKAEAQQKLNLLLEQKSVTDCNETKSDLESDIKSHEGTVASIDEVVSAVNKLRDVSDDDMARELVNILDANKDGIIDVSEVIKAMEFISSNVSTGISANEIRDMIVVLSKEKEVEKIETETEKRNENSGKVDNGQSSKDHSA